MTLRIKYWYCLCGGNGILTLISASSGRLGYLLFGMAMTIGSWYMAEYLLKKETEDALRDK